MPLIYDVMTRFRLLGKCSRCKHYKTRCKKIMDRDKEDECKKLMNEGKL